MSVRAGRLRREAAQTAPGASAAAVRGRRLPRGLRPGSALPPTLLALLCDPRCESVLWLAAHLCHNSRTQSPAGIAAVLAPVLVAGSGAGGVVSPEEAAVVEFCVRYYRALFEGHAVL
eukprot:1597879-Rhodomonas_salina.1